MGLMKIGEKYYVSFKWKGNRIRTVTPATNLADAKKIEKSVKTAFKIGTFGHLEPECLDVVLRTYENNGWALPPELARPEPVEELTLIKAIKDYLQADPKHRAERNLYAIDRIVEHFGENYPVVGVKVGSGEAIPGCQAEEGRKQHRRTVRCRLSRVSSDFSWRLGPWTSTPA